MPLFRRHVTVQFDDFFILVTSTIKVFKVTTSNTRNLKGILAFIKTYFRFCFIGQCHSFAGNFDDFLILFTSITKAFKITTLKTRNLKGILTFFLFLKSKNTIHKRELLINFTGMTKIYTSLLQLICLRIKGNRVYSAISEVEYNFLRR